MASRPDVLVLIDFGAFNARAAAWARPQGMRVFYYFPPGSWRRGRLRPGPRSLPEVTDRIATPFPWSQTALREAGADAHFVGHPLLDIARPTLSRAEFRMLHGIPLNAPLICYLPGSRRHELRHIWPAMRGAASLLSQNIPGLAHIVALAPSVRGVWSDRWSADQGNGLMTADPSPHFTRCARQRRFTTRWRLAIWPSPSREL